MESLFIVNPRKKRRKGRMPAGLRRYWASRRGGKTRKRRKARAVMANPRRRRRRARARNPRRRRHRARAHNPRRRRRRAHNPVFSHRRKRRRSHNPFSTGGLKAVLVPAGIGAAGAIATAIAYGYLSPQLPTTFTTGYFPTLVKAAAAIGLGMLVGKFMSRQDGQYAAIGGLTVVLVGAVTPLITSAAPTIPGLSGLAGYGDYIPVRRAMGGPATLMNRMGAYSPGLARGTTTRFGKLGRMGFVSPAPRLGAYMGRGATAGDMSGSGFNGLNDGM
jgi:hypothetical protein